MTAPVRLLSVATLGLLLLGCRGRSPNAAAKDGGLPALVAELSPRVEEAVGLRFSSVPISAVVSREAVRSYLAQQLERELPKRRRDGLVGAYRLLGLLPDSLDLEALILKLYSEQVAGYYDFDTKTLYGVEGADETQLRLVMAHELVHALQGQHLPLDTIMNDTSIDNDRKTARQAVLEGQATLASIMVLTPGRALLEDAAFWELYREQIAEAQDKLPAFKSAPAVLKSGLIFPYLNGAEFMRWWLQTRGRDSMPFGAAMPQSTEQILAPDRLARGDAPVRLRLDPLPALGDELLQDALGELELRILSDEVRGTQLINRPVPIGWGGDRYRVWQTPNGPALELVIVWDDARGAERFAPVLRAVADAQPAGRRAVLQSEIRDGRPLDRLLIGPEGWAGFASAAAVSVEPPAN